MSFSRRRLDHGIPYGDNRRPYVESPSPWPWSPAGITPSITTVGKPFGKCLGRGFGRHTPPSPPHLRRVTPRLPRHRCPCLPHILDAAGWPPPPPAVTASQPRRRSVTAPASLASSPSLPYGNHASHSGQTHVFSCLTTKEFTDKPVTCQSNAHRWGCRDASGLVK
jgi:hypothetical protein